MLRVALKAEYHRLITAAVCSTECAVSPESTSVLLIGLFALNPADSIPLPET